MLPKENKKQYIGIIIIVITSMLGILTVCISSSPIFPDLFTGNSAIQMVYGKSFLHSIYPYKDVFATAGPVYYLLQAIAWIGGHGRGGIFILECINMIGASVLVYQFLQRKWEVQWSILFTLIFQVISLSCIGIGNTEQEFCLLFLMISLYAITKEKFQWMDAAMLGLSTALVGMIRLDVAVIYVGFWMALIIGNKLKEDTVSKLIALFASTVLSSAIVYFIYSRFGVTDGFKRQYIIYGFKRMFLEFGDKTVWIHKFAKTIPAILLFILAVIMWKKVKHETAKVMLPILVASIIFCILGNEQWSGFLINGVLFVVAVYLTKDIQQMKTLLVVMTGVFVLLHIPAMNACVQNVRTAAKGSYKTYNKDVKVEAELFSEIKNKRNTYMLYDASGNFYLVGNMYPNYFYFADMDDIIRIDKKAEKDIVKRCKQENILIVYGDAQHMMKQKAVNQLLNKQYRYYGNLKIDTDTYGYFFMKG